MGWVPFGTAPPTPGDIEDQIKEAVDKEKANADAKAAIGMEKSKEVANLQGLASANAMAQNTAKAGLSPAQAGEQIAGGVAETNASTYAQQEAQRRGLQAQAMEQQQQLTQNQANREAGLLNQIISGGAGFIGALSGGRK